MTHCGCSDTFLFPILIYNVGVEILKSYKHSGILVHVFLKAFSGLISTRITKELLFNDFGTKWSQIQLVPITNIKSIGSLLCTKSIIASP